jgi:hypothetical protein
MPRKAIDYSKACIYKISCLDAEIEDIYVGSTTNLVKRRNDTRTHATILKVGSQSPRVQIHTGARRLGKLGSVSSREIQCDNSQDLCQREREVFEN